MAESRALMQRQDALFRSQGMAALGELQAIAAQLEALEQQAAQDFPLDAAGAARLREGIATALMQAQAVEERGIQALQSALA